MIELKAANSKQEAFVLNCNKLAMDHLHADRPSEALTLLLKAETQANALPVSASQVKLKSITLNNLGCFYKRAAKPQLALEYLMAALDLEATSTTDRTNLAGTHLNICAIKSQIGAHKEALQHAFEALNLLKVSPSDLNPNVLTTIVIAHHNAGVELEHLQQTQQAIDLYREGLEVAKENLGPEHPLTASLQKSYLQALDVASERTKGFKNRFVSITPTPGKFEPFATRKKPPRRSASKGSCDYSRKPSSSLTGRTEQMSRSYDESQEWSEDRGASEDEYRLRTKPSSKERRMPNGIQLQPLPLIAPLSKQSRRQKSFSAPNKSKPANLSPHSKPRPPMKSAAFRRSQSKKEEERSQLNSVMKVLSEKLACLEQKPDRIPRSTDLRKGKSLEVVNIACEEILFGRSANACKVVEALKVCLVRKSLSTKKAEGAMSVERRAHAAIAALEMLKKEALEETIKGSLPIGPKSKPPPRPDPARRLKFTKSRPLDPIPEAQVESKSERKSVRVVRIQSWIRMILARRRFLLQHAAAVRIQRWVRMRQTHDLFLSIKSAIQLIQAWWRLMLRRVVLRPCRRARLSL